MKPLIIFTESEKSLLISEFKTIQQDPYENYEIFSKSITKLIETGRIPPFFLDICKTIAYERNSGISLIHVIRNCPIDDDLPDLDLEDPLSSKKKLKKTFIGECFLELFNQLMETPLLAYGSRFGGNFFTDVIAIKKFKGQMTGFSDSELVYHNDRTAHSVRADYISLLGLRCPTDDIVITGFVDGKNLLKKLSSEDNNILREHYYETHFDVYSKSTNSSQQVSAPHAIIENEYSIRYLDTLTKVKKDAPPEAKDALINFKNALTLIEKSRHRILTGDLLVFANQDGLHNREKIEIVNPEETEKRWLLKTYAFKNFEVANNHSHLWLNNMFGRIAD
ncbi:TauD/TfdA family dioxygenase [Acinetobacter pittii]|uniref:TauD/TfdA family dioxygenase n=1 Tax=Acinetobacter pittii TaxID=48296 RepID=UPI001CD74EBA|nr:TauD/TfdA family dioxygenase [Acinetobacter pittii]